MKNLARKRLRELGLPRRRHDDWLYFPVAKLAQIEVPEAEDSEGEVDTLGLAGEGNYAALLPLAFAAKTLDKAIPAGAVENGILKTRDEFAHSKITIGSGATFKLELLGNSGDHEITAERLDVEVGEGASFALLLNEAERETAMRLMHVRIFAKAAANLRLDVLRHGAGVSRASFEVFLAGEGANLAFRSLSILGGESSSHTHLKIHHDAPETVSSQVARNLLSGTAHASYDGQVTVSANCKNANSSQIINTILQSEGAKISAKPVLRILHDEVECTHGCTCGSLDPEELYYMASRGFKPEDAKRLLARSFAREVFVKKEEESPFAERLVGELEQLGY